jgi:hypothetical protein
MEQILRVLDLVFGCHHGNLSMVFTIDRKSYRVCCDCGAKFQYSLVSMSMDHRRAQRSTPGTDLRIEKAV